MDLLVTRFSENTVLCRNFTRYKITTWIASLLLTGGLSPFLSYCSNTFRAHIYQKLKNRWRLTVTYGPSCNSILWKYRTLSLFHTLYENATWIAGLLLTGGLSPFFVIAPIHLELIYTKNLKIDEGWQLLMDLRVTRFSEYTVLCRYFTHVTKLQRELPVYY